MYLAYHVLLVGLAHAHAVVTRLSFPLPQESLWTRLIMQCACTCTNDEYQFMYMHMYVCVWVALKMNLITTMISGCLLGSSVSL